MPLRISLDPFGNYIKFVEVDPCDGSSHGVKSLDTTDIQKLFSNYKLINDLEWYLEKKTAVTFSKNNYLAMITTLNVSSPSQLRKYFINVYNGRITEYTFEEFCRYSGYFDEKYDNDEKKINFAKSVTPGKILNKAEDIIGYNKKKDIEEELVLIKPVCINKGIYIPKYKYVVVYSYTQLGGIVQKYVFSFNGDHLDGVGVKEIAYGVGDAQYLM